MSKINNKIKEVYKGDIYGANMVAIKTYKSWYRGFVQDFHNYRIYNGNDYISLKKKSLQMAKKVCESWADLLINEACDVVLKDKAKENLDVLFKKTKFWSKANRAVEIGFALTQSAVVGEIINGVMSFVTVGAENIVPLTVENDEVTEAAFYRVEGEKLILSIHMKDENGNYVIHNRTYVKDKEVLENRHILNTGLKQRLFMFIRPNIINNMEDGHTNFGMSVYANSIDVLKSLDTKYDNFDFEFVGGRKRLFLSVDAMKVVRDQSGVSVNTEPFDPLDTVFYNLGEPDDGKATVKDESGELRTEQFIQAINTVLSLLSHKVGLGYGYFKFDARGVATATQVIMENSDLFRNLKKHEILIRDEMIAFVDAVCSYSNKFCEFKIGEYDPSDIDILFDDSIIEDKDAMKKNDLTQVESGLMTYVEYAEKWKAMDSDTAKAKFQYLDWYKRAQTLAPLLHSKLITPEMAIEIIYKDDGMPIKPDINKLTEYINSDPLNIDDGEFDDGFDYVDDGDYE